MSSQHNNNIEEMLECMRIITGEKPIANVLTFEDIINRVDQHGIQVVLSYVDRNKLAVALRGASDATCDLFLSNMTARAANILHDEMARKSQISEHDVEDARVYVVQLVNEIAGRCEIGISE